MMRAKKARPLTREQYLKKFSRAVRWRLMPQESEEAISDYRELIFQEERDESKLVEELGEPVQAAHLLTDVKAYRRWLAVFAVLAFGVFLVARWCFTGRTHFDYVFGKRQYWYPVWVLIVGMALSLYWFRRYGQRKGRLSRRLILALTLVLAAGALIMGWTWYVTGPEFLERLAAEPNNASLSRLAWTLRDLLTYGGTVCAIVAFAGLVLAKCCDRRWLAVYILGLTVAALCVIVVFWLRSMSLDWGANELRDYFFPRMIPVGIVGLIGTGVALC